jgi:hypothetical protein
MDQADSVHSTPPTSTSEINSATIVIGFMGVIGSALVHSRVLDRLEEGREA